MRVGIDLGTTNTVVSYIDETGCWNPVEFRYAGSRENPHFLPSCVAVRNGEVLVGQPALDYGMSEPNNVLRNTKYYMEDTGRVFTVGNLQMTPADAATYVLREVYQELQRQFPNESSFHAFVTVPARFEQSARYATKKALCDAGFQTDEANCLTDEPIAAAIAYSASLDGDKLVLVVDIGGGTFDLSLLRTCIVGHAVSPNRLQPVMWGGELHLGGNDVDEIIVRKMADAFLQESGVDLSMPPDSLAYTREEESRAAAHLRSLAFQMKQQLYMEGSRQAIACVHDLIDGKTLDYTLTTAEYDAAMHDLTARFNRCIRDIYTGTGYSIGQTDHVLVVGGMARERCLLRTLEGIFGAGKLIVPDAQTAMTLVSKGAAICNSGSRVHVDNRAYTTIGLLRKEGTSVVEIIKEGDTIEPEQVFRQLISPARADATMLELKLVEYRGAFNPSTCTVILQETIPLVGNAKRGLRALLSRKPQPPELELEVIFTEDKLLDIHIRQTDGTVNRLDVRL
ncbi:MAG: Hsp70 family protein [Ruminococcus sp.]|nr:Hsp70 family protein [Ruminococcus sp.]